MLIFSYNIDLDGAEFTFVHYIQQLLKGEPLYLNPYEAPYSITIYTPLISSFSGSCLPVFRSKLH
jgi:hypothetical protein